MMHAFQVIGAISAVLVLAYLINLAARVIRGLGLRARQRNFERNRVTLEEVIAFKAKGCRHCGSSGRIKRAVNGQKSWLPCPCASNAFLRRYGKDTKMLGPFRVWKRGRRPSNVLSVNSGRGSRRAAA